MFVCRLLFLWTFLTVRGGINECYMAFYKRTANDSLYFYDKDGQYGYIAMTAEFPIGDYEVYKITRTLTACVLKSFF